MLYIERSDFFDVDGIDCTIFDDHITFLFQFFFYFFFTLTVRYFVIINKICFAGNVFQIMVYHTYTSISHIGIKYEVSPLSKIVFLYVQVKLLREVLANNTTSGNLAQPTYNNYMNS